MHDADPETDPNGTMQPWLSYWLHVEQTPCELIFSSTQVTQPSQLPSSGQSVDFDKLDLDVPIPPSPPLSIVASDGSLPVQVTRSLTTGEELTFSVPGSVPNVNEIKVEVYDTLGGKVYSSSYVEGRTLTWNLTTTEERKVANGIYLYRVMVKMDGDEIRMSEVRKLFVLK